MPVSSLVLHLSPDHDRRQRALRELEAHPAFLIGAPVARLLPAALETEDEALNKECWGWLSALPGVDFVEVLSVVFPLEPAASAQPGSTERAGRLRPRLTPSSPLDSGA